MSSEERVMPERWLSLVPFEGSVCGLRGCEGEVVAAQTMLRDLGDGLWGYEAVMSCSEHVALLERPQQLMPTCQIGAAEGDTPCGASATHLAIAGVTDETEGHLLRAVSVCSRHAVQLGGMLDATGD